MGSGLDPGDKLDVTRGSTASDQIPWYFTEPYDLATIDLYSSIAGRASQLNSSQNQKATLQTDLSESQNSKAAWLGQQSAKSETDSSKRRRYDKYTNKAEYEQWDLEKTKPKFVQLKMSANSGQVEPEFYHRVSTTS